MSIPNKRVICCGLVLVSLFICYMVYYPDNKNTFAVRLEAPDPEMIKLQHLSEILHKRLNYLQNPPDCTTARKLACKFDEACGYGCQVHHVVFCLIVAYATERTLVLEKGAGIYKGHTWDQVFLPLSDTCTSTDGPTQTNWPETSPVQVLHVPRIDKIEPQPEYIPMAIPAEFAPHLVRLHPDPSAWWIAQFLQYVMRYQPSTHAMIEETMAALNISTGHTVGVHVRRTDKYKEAKLRNLTDYMTVVDKYYDQREGDKRRIFLASDEMEVIQEARRNYPEYEIVVNERAVASAGLATRFSEDSLNGVIVDTHILSQMDFLVCTFSSNVCRLAYEMKMALNPRTARNYKSLDHAFFFAASHIGRTVVEMPRYSFLGEHSNKEST